MNLINLERMDKENNKDYVYRVLYESIIFNHLYPNEIVSETELQNHFEMSRSPIREALSILTNMGLLTVNPHRNTIVSPLNENIIKDTAFLRIAVDKTCLEACMKIDDLSPLIIELSSILNDGMQFKGESQMEFIKRIHIGIDEKFHDTIYRYAGFIELSSILKNVNTHYSRFRVLYLKEWLSNDVFFNNHISIINLLKLKDPSKINIFFEERLYNVLFNIKTIQKKYPNFFLDVSK